MKHTHLYALLLSPIFCLPCTAQGLNDGPKNGITSQTKDTVTSYGPNTMVRNVKEDSNGHILIAAMFTGVLRYDGKSFTNLTSKLGLHRFWNVLEDRRGNLWFSTTDSGVYCYNGKSFQHFTTSEGMASNAVICIYEDRAGVIWFGTGGGISRYDGKSFKNHTTQEGLSNNNVHTILEDKTGKFWFGTGGDACSFDGKVFTVLRNKDGKAFYNVWSIIEDNRGNIWFGASIVEDKKGNTLVVSPGLWRYDGSAFTEVAKRGASAIIEDKKGNIWTTGSLNPNGVGAWTLSRYDQKSLYSKKPVVTKIMSIQKMLCGLMEASDGSIWFGSMNGVYRYDGKAITDFTK